MLMEKLGPDGGHHCLREKGTHAIIRTFLSIYYFYICRSTCSLMGEKVDVNLIGLIKGKNGCMGRSKNLSFLYNGIIT